MEKSRQKALRHQFTQKVIYAKTKLRKLNLTSPIFTCKVFGVALSIHIVGVHYIGPLVIPFHVINSPNLTGLGGAKV